MYLPNEYLPQTAIQAIMLQCGNGVKILPTELIFSNHAWLSICRKKRYGLTAEKCRELMCRLGAGNARHFVFFYILPHNYVISVDKLEVHLCCGPFCPRSRRARAVFCLISATAVLWVVNFCNFHAWQFPLQFFVSFC